MSFVQNVPCFSILAAMFAAIITSALKGKAARRLSLCMTGAVGVMSAFLLAFLMGTGESYVYVMGHFPAPWGNELRAGMLEAAMALLFCVIMLLALWGGMEEARRDLEADKANFYYIMADLMLASNLALVYTNDFFTAYVFVEISTIAACGLILGKFNDLTIAAGVRYMIMSLMGSGLLLLGISFFYDMTGHLLVKVIYRVTGAEVFAGSEIINVLFVFGIIGMVLGSLDAVRQKNLRRMVAYSSVAQIGYIFMGIGLGTAAGTSAGLYHIFAHAAAKSLVFVAAFGLIKVSVHGGYPGVRRVCQQADVCGGVPGTAGLCGSGAGGAGGEHGAQCDLFYESGPDPVYSADCRGKSGRDEGADNRKSLAV